MIGILLNSLYITGEVVYGLLAHSLSLLADAGHNLSDVLGLAAAWLAHYLAGRAPSQRFTYGLKRATILTALGNATILLLVTGAILWQSLLHLLNPPVVKGGMVSVVALIGISVNAVTALLFMSGAKHDLNIRGAFLHMMSDAVMALAVVIAGLLISLTGFDIIDPIMSILVSVGIIIGTWSLLSQSLGLALDGVPKNIIIADVQAALLEIPDIADVHHLHIWPVSTTETALTVHLVRQEQTDNLTITAETLIAHATALLRDRFSITHPTFQIEPYRHSCPDTTCYETDNHTATSDEGTVS